MEFKREELSKSLIEEFEPLLYKHYEEIAHFKDIKLDPDWQTYYGAQKADVLRIFTARFQERLIGYAVFFMRYNPHYRQSLQAVQDILYFDPVHRSGYNSIQFIRWCDNELAKEGCQAVYHHVKQSKNFGVVLERLGYDLVDLIYVKRLG